MQKLKYERKRQTCCTLTVKEMKDWFKNTSKYSRARGMPTMRIIFWGRGFLQRDQRNTSIMTLSESALLPFVEWWFWYFSISRPCNWVAGIALTIFSPVKQSSYLQRIDKSFFMTSMRTQTSKGPWKPNSETTIFQEHHHHGSFEFHKLNRRSFIEKIGYKRKWN